MCTAPAQILSTAWPVVDAASSMLVKRNVNLEYTSLRTFWKSSKMTLQAKLPAVCHKGLDDVAIHIVDFVYADPDSAKAKYLRDLLEFNWIQRLHTNAPMGLNVMDLLRS